MNELDLDLCRAREIYDILQDEEVPKKGTANYDLLKSVKLSCNSVIHLLKYLKKLEQEEVVQSKLAK